MRRVFLSAVLLATLALGGCIDSASPILPNAEPVFGPRLRLQFYSLRGGFAHEPSQGDYRWNGGLYAHAAGKTGELSAFSVHPFEDGDYIIQTVPSGRIRVTEYALLHKLADGVFQAIAIDQDDADEATRVAYCRKAEQSACRIETREQLFAFARATAARRHQNGGLVIRLPDGSRPESAATRKRKR